MGLNDISLTNNLVAQLYRNSLIENEADTKVGVQQKHDAEIPYLGKNEKGVIIIVNCDEAPYLPDAHLAFLIKMLAACKLTIADVGIVNSCGNDKVEYGKVLKQLNPIKILFFDVSPAGIGFPMNFPQYQVQQYNNMKMLSAPALGILEKDLKEKNNLWISLKKMFDIN